MNGDVWRTPAGQVLVELSRHQVFQHHLVRGLVTREHASPWLGQEVQMHPLSSLVVEPARYEGARGGRG